jgi:hypothetical protein
MPRLDRSREYSEIIGRLPSPILEQDGHYFLPNGRLVDSEGHPLEEVAEEPIAASDEPETLEKMQWKKLLVLQRQYGREEWTTREDAIAFLRGQQITTP